MTTTFEIQRLTVDHLRAGRFEAAEQICRQILAAEPHNAEALHLLGVALHHRGQFASAIDHITRAIAQNGSQASYHNNLGNVLKEQGRAAEASECFRTALRLQPNLLQAYVNLAGALAAQGKGGEAIEVYRETLRIEPRFADAHYYLAVALADQNKLDEAIATLRQAISLRANFLEAEFTLGKLLKLRGQLPEAARTLKRVVGLKPNFALAHYQLGDVLRLQGRLAEAVAALQVAVHEDPKLLVAHNQLGNVLRDLGRLDEAALAYQQALRVDPLCAEAHSNLGNVYQDQGRTADAIACQREALRIQPDFALAHSALGASLQAQGDLAAARASYQRALEIDPQCATALHNLGTSLLQVRELAAARERFEEILRFEPDNAQAHYWSGFVRLSQGDFEGGWPEYEWRRKIKSFGRSYAEPTWTGDDLGGRKIRIHAEGGLGDTLQFIRYAPLVQKRGGDVLLVAQPTLIPLLQQSGFGQLSSTSAPPPRCDVWVPMLSLPGLFGTTVETIPSSIHYLAAKGELVDAWREKLQSYPGFKIAIHWHGNKTSILDARSIPLPQFETLTRVPGTTLISLQKGVGAEQLAQISGRFTVVDLGEEVDRLEGPFMDTAAIMSNMDLVITNDTAIAHLAGGLGVRVWVVLNYSAAWIWLQGREDSPWYPSMRLFWQTRFDSWSEAFELMTGELGRLVVERA
jgi:tetratricopeptide (TPR) repeat protein